ncbi:MAG: hypothetical protein HW405_83 [Candidatus Berkelbacteria bacterium]|nr:hypothetical protein [Candidatus Berkelbacteria bacterium]
MYDSFVFLYPHTAYFDTNEGNLCTNRPDTDLETIRQYFRDQVSRARSQSSLTTLIVVKQENGELNEISPLIGQSPDDILLPTNVAGTGLDAPTRNSDYEKLSRMITGQNILLGGFHLQDCVFQLALELFAQDRQVDIAMLTTDFFYDLLSLPDHAPKTIDPLSHPIPLPEFLRHFKERIKRIWDVELAV